MSRPSRTLSGPQRSRPISLTPLRSFRLVIARHEGAGRCSPCPPVDARSGWTSPAGVAALAAQCSQARRSQRMRKKRMHPTASLFPAVRADGDLGDVKAQALARSYTDSAVEIEVFGRKLGDKFPADVEDRLFATNIDFEHVLSR